VDLLRRLIGGPSRESGSDAQPADSTDPGTLDEDERERELEILRGEQHRLDDLRQRQLRYERHAWQPPAQGGERRADDGDRSSPG
jgi:hypothetical protein